MRFVVPASSWRAMVRHMVALKPLIRPAGAWFVLRGPDSSRGALIPPAAPSSVSRGPACPAGPWFVMRAVIRRSGPWSVLRGHDSYCEALIRSVVLDLSHRALIHLTGPDLSCGALIRLAGPSRGALVRSVEPWNLIKNRPHLGAQADPGGPASVCGAKDMLVPGDWPLGGMARMPPSPWDRHCHGVQFQTRLFPCTFAYICQKRHSL